MLNAPLLPAGAPWPAPRGLQAWPGPRGRLVPSAEAWRAAACLAPSRANAAKAWRGVRGQPLGPGPALSRPRSGTAPASWGPGGREPRRHAVEEARRCRRLSGRSPAPAAASLLLPGPSRGGQGPEAAGGCLERPPLLHPSAISPPARRDICSSEAGHIPDFKRP